MMFMNRRVRVFAWAEPVDMRKSFWSLSSMVETSGHRMLDGDVFLFIGRTRRRCKVLWFDGTGLILLAKVLEQGQFAPLWERCRNGDAQMSVSELSVFLEGNQQIASGTIVAKEFMPKSQETF